MVEMVARKLLGAFKLTLKTCLSLQAERFLNGYAPSTVARRCPMILDQVLVSIFFCFFGLLQKNRIHFLLSQKF